MNELGLLPSPLLWGGRLAFHPSLASFSAELSRPGATANGTIVFGVKWSQCHVCGLFKSSSMLEEGGLSLHFKDEEKVGQRR